MINSELGKYFDHMKGSRKTQRKSARKDLMQQRTEKYWNEKLENKVLDIMINMLGYYIGNKIIFKDPPPIHCTPPPSDPPQKIRIYR